MLQVFPTVSYEYFIKFRGLQIYRISGTCDTVFNYMGYPQPRAVKYPRGFLRTHDSN